MMLIDCKVCYRSGELKRGRRRDGAACAMDLSLYIECVCHIANLFAFGYSATVASIGLNKLNGIATGATKVAKSSSNGHILINDTDTVVYTHPTGDGNNHLPSGGSVGQVLRASGGGAGEWGTAIRVGATAPDNLLPNELFIKLL